MGHLDISLYHWGSHKFTLRCAYLASVSWGNWRNPNQSPWDLSTLKKKCIIHMYICIYVCMCVCVVKLNIHTWYTYTSTCICIYHHTIFIMLKSSAWRPCPRQATKQFFSLSQQFSVLLQKPAAELPPKFVRIWEKSHKHWKTIGKPLENGGLMGFYGILSLR